MEVDDMNVEAQVASLKKQFTVLSHQMSAVLARLGAPRCQCELCASMASSLPHLLAPCQIVAAAGARAAAQPAAATVPAANGSAVKVETAPSENGSCSTEDEGREESASHTPVLNGTPSHSFHVTPNLFEENPQGGRRSQHLKTKEAKLAVAEYAAIHGPARAAEKFLIPPTVAGYYHRKLKQAKQKDFVAAAIGGNGAAIKVEGTPGVDLGILTASGGRQRGRPKMIGDDLDAELMEFLIKAKSEDPNLKDLQQIRPELALDLARGFINSRVPEKLKENGGHIDLKMSWANKLVSRIAEREKEIALNLPIGTLNNVGINGLKQLQSGMMQTGFTDLSFLAQLAEQLNGDVIMPEVTSGKTLSLDDFMMVGDEDEVQEVVHCNALMQ